jgi:PAS domain-containing protein
MIEDTAGYDDTGRVDQYHHLIEHIKDDVVEFELVDGESIVIDVNEAFVDSFGYSRDDIVNNSLNEWIVKWTTKLFGGEPSFATSNLGGNNVRIRLRRQAMGYKPFTTPHQSTN